METLFFFLGILATVLVIIIATVVVGVRKLLKLEQTVTHTDRSLWQTTDELNRRIDEGLREGNESDGQLYSYIDSRLDKLEDKLTSNKQKSA